MGGIGALVDPLGLGGGGEPVRQLRIAGKELPGLFQLLPGLLGLRGELVQIAVGLLPGLLGQALLRLHAVGGDIGQKLGKIVQQAVHVLFPLEGALLLGAVTVLHHQIGNGAEQAAAGKAALAHGHPLKDPAHIRQGHIVAAVQKIAVEIQGLLAHAAGTEMPAGVFIGGHGFRRKSGGAETDRLKEHKLPP